MANERARLRNRELEAGVVPKERALAAVPTEQAPAAEFRNRDLNFIQALPGMHGDDRDAKFRLLMNDARRLASSELVIREVRSSPESATSARPEG